MQSSRPGFVAPKSGSSLPVPSSSPPTPSAQPQLPDPLLKPDFPEPRPPRPAAADIRGKHRRRAELNRLNLEIKFLEEELEKLEKTDLASVACEELVVKIENTPDPLLPVTKGSLGSTWDRWFERPSQPQSCCWIF